MQSRTRPTRYAAVPPVAAGILAVLAALTDGVWLFLLATAAVGLVGAAVVPRPRLDGLDCTLDAPVRATAGSPVTHVLTVRNTGRHTSAAARVTHRAPGFDDVTVALRPLSPGESAAVALPRTPRRRTHASRHSFVLTSTAPLGLLRATRVVELPGQFVVHPPLGPARGVPPRSTGGTEGPVTTSRDGVEPGTVREWRPGDGSRRVHWRSTARRGRLVVTEPERRESGRLVIVVAGPAGAPDWERLVSAVASAAVAHLRDGAAVALTARGHGTAEGAALLDWCAALRDPGPPDHDVLRRALAWAGRDGQMLLAAPADWRGEAWNAAREVAGGRVELFRPVDGPGA
jgi:uncharacterized protein (DUF58 family)